MSSAEKIRQYARQNYIQPAIQRGERKVQIRAGDVHNAMKLHRQHPNVCQALESKIFLKDNNLILETKEGPQSGQSSTMVYTYQLPQETSPLREDPPGTGQNLLKLLDLKGIGKEVFASLGGGENFLRSERKAFADAIEKQDRERGLL
jgi:hypothetical protein